SELSWRRPESEILCRGTLDSARTIVRKRASFTGGGAPSAACLRNTRLARRNSITAPCHKIAAKNMKKIKTATISILGASRGADLTLGITRDAAMTSGWKAVASLRE